MRRRPVVLSLCLAAGLMAGCSSPPGLDSYAVGPPGHQIHVAAAAGQHLRSTMAGVLWARNAVLPGAVNYATHLVLPDNGWVQVAITVPSGSVLPAHARWIINHYYNNVPERLTKWDGTSADAGVRPCSTPAGSCPGYLGGLQVFRSGVLYNVTISSDSSDTAWAVIHSIRIPGTA